MEVLNRNVSFLRPLLLFTYIFWIFPQPIYNKHSATESDRKLKVVNFFNKLYVVICTLFWILFDVMAIYNQSSMVVEISKSPQTVLLPAAIVGLILQCVMALFSAITLILFGFIHSNTFNNLLIKLDRLFSFLAIQILHGFYNFSLSVSVFKNKLSNVYLFRVLQIFQTTLIVITTNTLSTHIYHRFKRVNNLLMQFDQYADSSLVDSNPKLHSSSSYKYFMFKELKKIHSILCDQVDSINDMFGIPLLCFIVTSIIMICYFVMCVITVAFFEDTLSRGDKIKMMIISGSGILLITVELLSLAWSGALLSSETSKTNKICYTLLNTIPRPSLKGPERYFWKELNSLAIQSGFRQPFITTSGIFKVDFGILGAIMGSVTSYIIVAQQFLQQFEKVDREAHSLNDTYDGLLTF